MYWVNTKKPQKKNGMKAHNGHLANGDLTHQNN